VALVHPDLDRETEEILADVLKVSLKISVLRIRDPVPFDPWIRDPE
jgi:hypothetical protein